MLENICLIDMLTDVIQGTGERARDENTSCKVFHCV